MARPKDSYVKERWSDLDLSHQFLNLNVFICNLELVIPTLKVWKGNVAFHSSKYEMLPIIKPSASAEP